MCTDTRSRVRATIETAFFRNNCVPIPTIQAAYTLALDAPSTIVTDMPIYKPEHLHLPADAKVIVNNDGAVTGRCAQARRVIGSPGVQADTYAPLLREAIYHTGHKPMLRTSAVVGLDEHFSVRAHLQVPKAHAHLLYNWLLNFQEVSQAYAELPDRSAPFKQEGDLFIFSDPDWSHPDYPQGLALFDPQSNCAALLGLRYFGEHKKGTLTLAWALANRHGFAACHGGMKRYGRTDGQAFVAAVFGLSGSGKSTLTHARHDGKYPVTILHDDAFVLDVASGAATALEPSYFDKTQDYPGDHLDNTYLLSAQNCAVTLNSSGEKILLTEDIRNGNGRAIKSRLWSDNRVNHFEDPINAVIWLMKDPVLPPVLRIDDPDLGAAMGATLATKRTSAEHIVGKADRDALVFEPYANPFRTHGLGEDFQKFRTVLNKPETACYIVNTGSFQNQKISKETTLACLESIVDGTGQYRSWGPLPHTHAMTVPGFACDWTDPRYRQQVKDALQRRLTFVQERSKDPYDQLPQAAVDAIKHLLTALEKRFSHVA